MSPPSAPPPGPPAKNGPSGLAIFGLGCLGLAVIIVIAGAVIGFKGFQKFRKVYDESGGDPAKAAAMMVVAANPDLEVVSTDTRKGEIKVRDKKSGQVTTMSMDELAKGKFTVKDADGTETTVDVSQSSGGGKMTVKGPDGQTTIVTGGTVAPLPGWIPTYPGGDAMPGGLHTESADGVAGTHQLRTADPVAKVKDTLDAQWKAAGFQTEVAVISADGNDMATINATKEEGKYTLNAVITAEKGKTQVITSYQGPKR